MSRKQSKEDKIRELISASRNYVKADKTLEDACGDKADPIACTVYALKGQNVDAIPEESFDAAKWLSEVIRIHEELVTNYNMDADEVRKIWFPILNGEK